jgi:hypothetical protein
MSFSWNVSLESDSSLDSISLSLRSVEVVLRELEDWSCRCTLDLFCRRGSLCGVLLVLSALAILEVVVVIPVDLGGGRELVRMGGV